MEGVQAHLQSPDTKVYFCFFLIYQTTNVTARKFLLGAFHKIIL